MVLSWHRASGEGLTTDKRTDILILLLCEVETECPSSVPVYLCSMPLCFLSVHSSVQDPVFIIYSEKGSYKGFMHVHPSHKERAF